MSMCWVFGKVGSFAKQSIRFDSSHNRLYLWYCGMHRTTTMMVTVEANDIVYLRSRNKITKLFGQAHWKKNRMNEKRIFIKIYPFMFDFSVFFSMFLEYFLVVVGRWTSFMAICVRIVVGFDCGTTLTFHTMELFERSGIVSDFSALRGLCDGLNASTLQIWDARLAYGLQSYDFGTHSNVYIGFILFFSLFLSLMPKCRIVLLSKQYKRIVC